MTCAGFLAAAALWGCGGSSGSATLPAAPQAPGQTESIAFGEGGFVATAATTAAIGVRLNGELPAQNKHYGQLLGYALGTTSKQTHVVRLTRGETVVFHNVDASDAHTASFLGDATKQSAPWPKSFDGSATASKAGSDISSPKFSTGPMNPGQKSLKYAANVPGFYMFGCAFHYGFGMRDIIIVT